MTNIIDIKSKLTDERVLALLSHSQYMPTMEKLSALVARYVADERVSTFACVKDGSPIGLIVLTRLDERDIKIGRDIKAVRGTRCALPASSAIPASSALSTSSAQHCGAHPYEIVSIAVDPAHRGRGIGRELIDYAATVLRCSEIRAETDDDAVGFYRAYGFAIQSLGEKYPGVVRYMCALLLT